MMASRGMGAMKKDKIPGATVKKRRDNTDFLQFAEGGSTDKWIAGAIKKKGALRKELGAKPGQPIPAKKLAKAAKAPGKLGQRARLAETLKGMKK